MQRDDSKERKGDAQSTSEVQRQIRDAFRVHNGTYYVHYFHVLMALCHHAFKWRLLEEYRRNFMFYLEGRWPASDRRTTHHVLPVGTAYI